MHVTVRTVEHVVDSSAILAHNSFGVVKIRPYVYSDGVYIRTNIGISYDNGIVYIGY